MEVNKKCINFMRQDMFRIKIKLLSLRTFEPITVNEGVRDHSDPPSSVPKGFKMG